MILFHVKFNKFTSFLFYWMKMNTYLTAQWYRLRSSRRARVRTTWTPTHRPARMRAAACATRLWRCGSWPPLTPASRPSSGRYSRSGSFSITPRSLKRWVSIFISEKIGLLKVLIQIEKRCNKIQTSGLKTITVSILLCVLILFQLYSLIMFKRMDYK